MHINWLKNQNCVLGCMLRSHARNGNEFQTPGHCWLPGKHWDAWFLNSSKSKTHLKFMKLGMLSWSDINMSWYKFYPIWGRFRDMLLTTSMIVFSRERPTFGDETISISSYCFQIFSRVNIEQQECCVNLCDFSGFVWTFLYINWVFIAFMCIIRIWTIGTCSNAYKLVENSNFSPWLHA